MENLIGDLIEEILRGLAVEYPEAVDHELDDQAPGHARSRRVDRCQHRPTSRSAELVAAPSAPPVLLPA